MGERFILLHLNKPFDSSMMSRSIVSTKISCFHMPKNVFCRFRWEFERQLPITFGAANEASDCSRESEAKRNKWKKEYNRLLHWNNRRQSRECEIRRNEKNERDCFPSDESVWCVYCVISSPALGLFAFCPVVALLYPFELMCCDYNNEIHYVRVFCHCFGLF